MKSKRELNQQYRDALLEVRSIINLIDPIDLFPGCPEDEYDPEVADILAGMSYFYTAHELYILVHHVFEKWFGEKIEADRLNDVGEKLLIIKHKYQWLKNG